MNKEITAKKLFNNLSDMHLENYKGAITFNMANVSVKIDTTDTVGITLQSWLKKYMQDNNIYFSEPENTQEFPDFYLSKNDRFKHMLEVKAFNYVKTPAFDIANFESYCASVKEKPYRLDADYLIFGYTMESNGDISVQKIWLKKIYEIAGTSANYALKTQVKRGMIYNIRPNNDFKNNNVGPFNNREEFLKAIYDTLEIYKSKKIAEDWKKILNSNYKDYYGITLPF